MEFETRRRGGNIRPNYVTMSAATEQILLDIYLSSMQN